jgi:hypothetical protein
MCTSEFEVVFNQSVFSRQQLSRQGSLVPEPLSSLQLKVKMATKYEVHHQRSNTAVRPGIPIRSL